MEWLPPIKDAWWLYGALVALLGAFVRAILKAHYYKEQIETVQKHDLQIGEINKRMESIEHDSAEMKQGISSLKDSLQEHREENRRDISTLMDGLLSLVDGLKILDPNNKDFNDAHKKIRKRQIER